LETEVDQTYTVDLYQVYRNQFDSNTIKSPSAPNLLTALPAATDFYYYVAGYDTDVFDNISIDANGKLTYHVKDTATDATYLNIVLVEKH